MFSIGGGVGTCVGTGWCSIGVRVLDESFDAGRVVVTVGRGGWRVTGNGPIRPSPAA